MKAMITYAERPQNPVTDWVPGWVETMRYSDIPIVPYDGTKGTTFAYECASVRAVGDKVDVVIHLHNDVEIKEKEWDRRVMAEFEDPEVGVVGFGGSLWHGDPDIYKKPYHISQLGRSFYFSNVDDAETHGGRFTGEMDVATLDGFCLIVRRELLNKMGGWQPDKWPPHHVYDHRLTLEARRHGYRVRLVGVRCHHHGGRTATTPEYQEWARTTKWGSDAEMHAIGHRMIYDEYRDVLPVLLDLEGEGRR